MAALGPEATDFTELRSGMHCRNCGRVSSAKDFCDYCQFPLSNDVVDEDPAELVGGSGEVTIFTPPTDPPEGADPGSHGGML